MIDRERLQVALGVLSGRIAWGSVSTKEYQALGFGGGPVAGWSCGPDWGQVCEAAEEVVLEAFDVITAALEGKGNAPA